LAKQANKEYYRLLHVFYFTLETLKFRYYMY